ncbi:MAG: hypothetical protein CYG61_01665 [Actinobacteria bacterium]|nr:MAG: hypothetical protein CYG61_01665 [Actinomycetota bacterium]
MASRAAVTGTGGTAARSGDGGKAKATAALARLPLSFEENLGQAGGDARFVARAGGYSLALAPTGATLSLAPPRDKGEDNDNGQDNARPKAPSVVRFAFAGADPNPHMEAMEPLSGVSNYLVGNDSSRWRTGVTRYAKVAYRDLYPGIDLVLYGKGADLEYDFVVAPGADPARITLAVEGAEALRVEPGGELVVGTAAGEVRQHVPAIYQEIGGRRRAVSGGFKLQPRNEVGFSLGSYDHTRPLVIDPVVAYATYLGSKDGDEGDAVAVDPAGNAYVTGYTTLAPQDGCVSESDRFPTTPGAFMAQPGCKASADAFVAKFDPRGRLVYSTVLGGTLNDERAWGIAVDGAGTAYLTGVTHSEDFPVTASAFQPTAGLTPGSAFVTRLNATGTALVYSSYFAGVAGDGELIQQGLGIAVDGAGRAWITGVTQSSTLPTTPGAFQPTARGADDAFVAKFDTNLAGPASLVYSTYLGGDPNLHWAEQGQDVAVDAAGNAYVVGTTWGPSFPVTLKTAYQPTYRKGQTPFLTVLNPAGSALVYSTYFGELGYGMGVAVDPRPSHAGMVYVTGATHSPDFPTTPGAFDRTCGDDGACSPDAVGAPRSDAFVAKFDTTASGPASLVYSTYLGGHGSEDYHQGCGNGPEPGYLDYGQGCGGIEVDPRGKVVVDASGNAWVSGWTSSPDFPTTPVGATLPRDSHGAFVAGLNPTGTALVSSTLFLGATNGSDLALDAAGNVWVASFGCCKGYGEYSTSDAFQRTVKGYYDASVTKLTPASVVSFPATAPSGQYSDSGVVAANVSLEGTSPLPGARVNFTLAGPGGSATATATSGTDGVATARLPLTLAPGTYQLTARYDGSSKPDVVGSSATTDFVVTRDDSAMALAVSGTSPKRVLTATLSDADTPTTRLAGRTVAFFANGVAIGSVTTGSDGTARLRPPSKYQKAKAAFTATFSGDDYYGGSTATKRT